MESETVREIYSDQIDEPSIPMRGDIDRDALHDLADNIKENGLINPITVRPRDGRFEVVAGHRRFLACRIAGKIRIPCVVRELTDAEYFAIMTAENLERNDVDPVDEALHLKRHMDMSGESVSDVARRIKRSEQYVKDRLVIAEMPEYMQSALKFGQMKIGVALQLVQIEPDEKRRVWCTIAVQDSVSVRTAEYWVYQHNVGLLPSGKSEDGSTPQPGAEPYKPILFRCAIDGKEYPMSETKAVTIYKGNEHLLAELRSALNEPVAAN